MFLKENWYISEYKGVYLSFLTTDGERYNWVLMNNIICINHKELNRAIRKAGFIFQKLF